MSTLDILMLTALAEIIAACFWFQFKSCAVPDEAPLSREQQTARRIERAIAEQTKTQRFRAARGLK